MNRYSLNLIMLLLLSVSNGAVIAEEQESNQGQSATAFMKLESANDQVPTDEYHAQAQIEAAKKKSETVTLNATIDRAWGLLLGDEFSVKVDTKTLAIAVDESSLPVTGKRYGTWLYLKNIDIEAQQLVFQYQITNVPIKNTVITTPSFDAKLNNGQWFEVPSVDLSIGPALAVGSGVNNIKIKQDSAPTLLPVDKVKSDLTLFTVIALVLWLLLAVWHFGWKTKNRDPFAQAIHDLSRLRWQRSVTPDRASRILHTAFNHTSNTIVVYGELDTLLDNTPWLSPLSEEIKDFYQQSEQYFFARKTGQEPDIEMIKKLAKACRSKERLA